MPESILRDVQVFMLFYLLTFAVTAAVVVTFGADLVTGITASIACLGNIGPGFNQVGRNGQLWPAPSRQQDCADAGDVDRSARSHCRLSLLSFRGMALSSLVG